MNRNGWLTGVTVLACVVLPLAGGCAGDSQPVQVDIRKAYIDGRSTLLQMVEAQDPCVRSNAIEALAQTVGAEAGDVYLQALKDKDPIVRFAAAVAVGDTRYAPAKDILTGMGKTEPDKRVFAGVIYALYRLGDQQYAGEVGKLLFDREKEVRAVAAMVMGKMGEPSAVGPLRSLLGDEQEPMVQLQLTESLSLLGDSRSTMLLEAYTKTTFLDDRLVAIPALARTRTQRAVAVLRELNRKEQPLRVRVSAVGGLAMLGCYTQDDFELVSLAARNPCEALIKACEKAPDTTAVYSLQRLAALSLGHMKCQGVVEVLHPLLCSEDGAVRVAAAMSLLRLLPKAQAPAPATPACPAPATCPTAATGPAPSAGASAGAASEAPKPRLYTAGAKD